MNLNLAAVIADLLAEIGEEAAETLALAALPETKERLRSQTDRALAAGLFGAPAFRAGEELFWGNDRLEAALDWAVKSAGRTWRATGSLAGGPPWEFE